MQKVSVWVVFFGKKCVIFYKGRKVVKLQAADRLIVNYFLAETRHWIGSFARYVYICWKFPFNLLFI